MNNSNTFLVGLVAHGKRVVAKCNRLSVQHVRSHSLESRTADESTVIRVNVDTRAVDEQKVPTPHSMQHSAQAGLLSVK